MKKKLLRVCIVIGLLLTLLACELGSDPQPTVTPMPKEGTVEPGPAPDETPVPESDDRQLRQTLLRATVQILALENQGSQVQPLWNGSGTIISKDGLILTNAHVVSDPNPQYQPDALGIAMTSRSDELPELRYLAEIKAIDQDLDLAVIQIATDLSGSPVNVEQLNLDYVPLGDSDNLELGDIIQILGYPGIGGETITFTEGVVSGFTRERGVEGRAYVKTDATIAGGNSGGLGANQSGALVGVPTQVGYGGALRFADCRYLADTNNDGRIDENDNCIPVGGFINALRPINLAKPLVEAARLGIAPRPEQPPGPSTPSGDARFYDIVFSPDVTENDQPTRIVTQLPSGTIDIYAFWEYAGMADGVLWEARWYEDGEYLENASWPPNTWQGGAAGSWWISIYNEDGLSDGTYRVELYIDDELATESSITVGGTQTVSGPAFSNLVFSEDITNDERPTNPTFLLPSGIQEVYAFFDYDEMENGLSFSRTWYYGGNEIASGSATWEDGRNGTSWVALSSEDTLNPGTYRLELFVEGRLTGAANFTVAGTQGGEAVGPITFATGIDTQGNPINPGNQFATGLQELHFFCSYEGMQPGMGGVERWLLNGEELAAFDFVWPDETGTFHDYIYLTAGGSLPDGTYTLEIYVEDQKVQEGTAVVGTGTPPPTPEPPPADGLYIQGYVLDADTGRGIAGALYVVLEPGITVNAWDGSEDEIYTTAETDTNGYFELPLPLVRGERYSLIVWAEGYQPAGGDNLLVGDDPSPLEVEVNLQRE
ncbi:MAG: trypsin-like peptidase domain-containing protein [Anaerolineae bacterium]